MYHSIACKAQNMNTPIQGVARRIGQVSEACSTDHKEINRSQFRWMLVSDFFLPSTPHK
jgi:hypothetical protein